MSEVTGSEPAASAPADRPASGLPREIVMMVAHHEQLQSRLDRDTSALSSAVAGGGDFGPARGVLHGFLTAEVIPHALAEEDAIYAAGTAVDRLAALVAGMLMEHHELVDLAAAIERAGTGIEAVSAAVAFRSLFAVHVRKENDLLLPGLLAAGTDPAELLATMHAAFETRRREAAATPSDTVDTDGLRAHSGERVVDTRVEADQSCAGLANDAVDALAPGGSFVLVADHDPRGIHYMLQAERPGGTTWELLEDGPQRWQARIGKSVIAAAHAG